MRPVLDELFASAHCRDHACFTSCGKYIAEMAEIYERRARSAGQGLFN
jgi:hypothetical protein